MRGLFYPLIMLIVSLVVLVALVFVRPQGWWPEGPRNVSELMQLAAPAKPISAAKPAAATDGPPATKRGIASKGLVQADHPQPVEARGSGPNITAPTLPPERKYPFPTAEHIVAGTPETMILAAFGRPEVRVTGAETGEIRERYVYVDRQTGRKTYIALVNAKVTSVGTFNP
jgi:hypothetical protein